MRELATIVLMGGAMIAAPLAMQLPVGAQAPVSIAAGCLLAGVACESFTALTIASGAAAALAWHLCVSGDVLLAGAMFVGLVWSTRSQRGSSKSWRFAHLAASVLGGASAAWVAQTYGGSEVLSVRLAALLVAGLLASVSLVFPADDVVTYGLAGRAKELPSDLGDLVIRAAMLRRRVRDSAATESLNEATSVRLEQAWNALLEIVSQRVAMTNIQGAAIAVLDGRIKQHTESLERIHAAADERYARNAGLTDQRLAAATLDGETLETEVRALVEISAQ
jgi:hypothetical protein